MNKHKFNTLKKRFISSKMIDVLLILYTFVLIILNISRILNNNFYGDECWSIWLANKSIWGLLGATAGDVHPPLYYVWLKCFIKVFKNSGWVYHLSATVPYILECVFILGVIKKEFGNKCAFILITFISLLKWCIYMNQEVRMYSLASLFCLLSYYYLYKLLKDNKTIYKAIFVISSLGAAYSHYYALVTVAFFYIYLLIRTIEKKFPIKDLLIIYIITILIYLPWAIVLLKTFLRTSSSWWMSYRFTFLNSVKIFFNSSSNIYTYGMLIILLALLVWYTFINIKENKEISLLNRWLIVGVISAVGTILVGLAVSYYIRPMFQPKYAYQSVVIVLLVFSILLTRSKNNIYIYI